MLRVVFSLLIVSLLNLDLGVVSCGSRFFSLVVDNAAVPGYSRNITRVNQTAPGPTLRVTEGDQVTIRLINAINDNATIHWHGIFQHQTPYNDGVPGVTQCAVPTGQEILYTFIASPPGTHFYHAHYHLQMVDGLFGALIIDPLPSPIAPPPYDDEIVLVMHDYYNMPALTLNDWFLSTASGGNEPPPDKIAVNGKFGIQAPFLTYNVNRRDKVRVRMINAAAFSMWNFTVDSLALSVIEVDGTLVSPLDVPYVVLNAAQRVSVIVDFAKLDNTNIQNENAIYWRIHAMVSMYPVDPTVNLPPYEPNGEFFNPEFKAVFSFDSSSSTLPSYDANNIDDQIVKGYTFDDRQETNLFIARPLLQERAPDATHQMYMEIEFFQDSEGVNRGHFNNIAYIAEDAEPILHQLIHGDTLKVPLVKPDAQNNIMGNSISQYYIPAGAVVDMILNNTDTGEHPFHMHGHTFYVLSSSDFPDAETVYRDNYVRRDIVSVPLSGWAKIRFVANNPGAWAFHCHIDWHMASGLFATLVSSPELLVNNSSYIIPADHTKICQETYPNTHDLEFYEAYYNRVDKH